MKKQNVFKYATTICFLLFIGIMYVTSLKPLLIGTKIMVFNTLQNKSLDFMQIEDYYQDTMPAKTTFINLHGGWQKVMGARKVNDRYRLDNGQLTYTLEKMDVSEIASNTLALQEAMEVRNIPLYYINFPFKIHQSNACVPVGVQDYSNENADAYLAILQAGGMEVLDLRNTIDQNGIDHYGLFYSTDHHWTAEAGFWATGQIVQYLRQHDASFAVDPAILDLNNYDLDVRERIFLGSAGQRVGLMYAQPDDLTLITPKFETNLQLTSPDNHLDRIGSFQDTMLFPSHLEGDIMEVARYCVYSGGNYTALLSSNTSREDGFQHQSTNKRILVIRDSFSMVVAPFLSLAYDECCYLDLREFTGDVIAYIDDYQPDAVIVMYNPGAYDPSNECMFQFISHSRK